MAYAGKWWVCAMTNPRLKIGGTILVFAALALLTYGVGIDTVLRAAVAILPTALGVAAAVQGFQKPLVHHHRKWRLGYIIAGLVISAAVFWQQSRTERNSEAERKALQDQIGELQHQVNRSLFQIRDVAVSFLIRVPLTDPALAAYHDRIEKCAEEMRQTTELKCGAKPHFFDMTGQRKTRKDFSIPPWSELYPQKKTEEIAYLMLNQPSFKISLFKDSPRSVDAPDLSFRVGQLIDSPSNDRGGYPLVFLYYDMESREMFIEGNRLVPVDGNWYSTGRIAAIQDLADVWIAADPGCLTPTVPALGGDTEEYLTLRRLTCEFENVRLSVSNGWEFELSRVAVSKVAVNKQNETCYVGRLGRVTPPFP
jgi:hypothetical protein